MAKKVKRKVSAVEQRASQISDVATMNETSAPVAAGSSAGARSFGRRAAVQEFNPDYTYVVKDLKRIGMLAGTFFVLLIALSFLLPVIFPAFK